MPGIFVGRLQKIDRDLGRLIASDGQSFRVDAPARIPPALAPGDLVRIYFEERDGEAWMLEVRRG